MNLNRSLLERTACGYRSVPVAAAAGREEWRIGTLLYTRGGLIVTIAAISWGVVCINLIGGVFNLFNSLNLKSAGASDSVIALLTMTVPAVLNMIITPIVSFRSDRTRSRLGRRMPYLLLTAPFLTLFLVMYGCAPGTIEWLRQVLPGRNAILPLAVFSFLAMGYQVFYLILMTVIYYLFPDVIPEKFVGRFMSIFNIVGSLTGLLFNKFLTPLGDRHQSVMFIAIGILYGVSMVLLAGVVREGRYPEVEDTARFARDRLSLRVLKSCRLFFSECFTIPFYYGFYATMILSDVSLACRYTFNTLYAMNSLHMNFVQLGQVGFYSGLVGVALAYPVGMLVDRFHSMRIFPVGLVLVIAVNLVSFFWVRDYAGFMVSSILLAVVYCIQNTSTLPVFIDILPKAQFGQFSSAVALLRAGAMAVCSYGGGLLIEYLGDYQYLYLWDFAFTVASLSVFILFYRNWARRGGRNYIAPTVRSGLTRPDSCRISPRA